MPAECGYSTKCLGHIRFQPTAPFRILLTAAQAEQAAADKKTWGKKSGLIPVYIMSNK